MENTDLNKLTGVLEELNIHYTIEKKKSVRRLVIIDYWEKETQFYFDEEGKIVQFTGLPFLPK